MRNRTPLPYLWIVIALLTGLALAGYGLWQTPAVHASLNGRVGFSGNPATNSGATCTACHATGAAVPAVTLQGPTTVTAGATNLYTLTITGGPAQTAGLNLSVGNNRGALLPTGPDMQALLGELTHSAPKAFTGNQARFTFTWTAPTFNDTITVYAAANSTNGQQDLSGDGIGTTSLAIQVTGGTGGPPATSPTPPAATLGLTAIVTSGLSQPTNIVHAGDARLFVTEKEGRIRIVQNGALLATPFLDITGRVEAGDGTVETGLLGLAFHPQSATNGYFYVNYTVASPLRTRIARFQISASNANQADPNSEQIVLEFLQPASNHNGGQLQFGPDGYLYIAAGDGGGQGDPSNYGQTNSVLLGKILRIDVDSATGNAPDCNTNGGTNYRIPPDNPLADGAGRACDEIWASGLRNPWRFSFDRLTGDLWIADVGQTRFEEINFAPASSAGGENYGWRCYEGNTAYNTTGCQPAGSYAAPLHVYNRSLGDCSVTGGYRYRGSAYPNLYGHYFFSDFCNKTIRSISGAPDTVVVTSWIANGGGSNPITFGEDQAGELYVGYFTGEIYRITGSGAPSTATPTPTATNTATMIPPTQTPTPSPTASNTPTATPSPTATPTGALVRVDTQVVEPDQPISTTVTVAVLNVPANTPLGAVTLQVGYDPAQLTVLGCTPAPQHGFDSLVCNANEAGVVRISALSTAGRTGSAPLVLIGLQSPNIGRAVAPLVLTATTFVDVGAQSIAVTLQNGALISGCRSGDVDCDGALTPSDALFMVQHERGIRPTSDTIPPPTGFLYGPACDLNGDDGCTREDARLILQCAIGEQNEVCREGE